LPTRKRIDRVDLHESPALPERQRRLVRRVAGRPVEGLDLDDPHAVACQGVEDLVHQLGAETLAPSFRNHGRPEDLARRGRPSIDDAEPDDQVVVDDHPGVVDREIAPDRFRHIWREVVRKAADDVEAGVAVLGGCLSDDGHDSIICDVTSADTPYYRPDLALVHHLGFGFHADTCAPGILALLERVRARDGLVVELGCGSGLLTRHLVDAGHRVIATDASDAMLELARDHAPGTEDLRQLVLPDDPIPAADAIVGVGHVLNYLPDEQAIERAWAAIAKAIRPEGLLAIDLCDLQWGAVRRDVPTYVRKTEEWVIVTEFSVPSPTRFVREMTTFVRNEDGSWRRDDERHDNVLVDTSRVAGVLAELGLDVRIATAFGDEQLPPGLVTVIGERAADG